MALVPGLLLLATCGGTTGGTTDALAGNPPRLWLAGINGSESNLQLIESGPPGPF